MVSPSTGWTVLKQVDEAEGVSSIVSGHAEFEMAIADWKGEHHFAGWIQACVSEKEIFLANAIHLRVMSADNLKAGNEVRTQI